MTKSAELEALRRFAESIPQDSYLRPWLTEIMPEVEADIRNDFCITPSIKRTQERCHQLIGETNARIAEMMARAQQDAHAIVAEAHHDAQSIRTRIADVLNLCERTINA